MMNATSAIDLDRLDALAAAATGGDWTLTPTGIVTSGQYAVADPYNQQPGDAAYLAAINPATIRALIARVRVAEGQPVADPTPASPEPPADDYTVELGVEVNAAFPDEVPWAKITGMGVEVIVSRYHQRDKDTERDIPTDTLMVDVLADDASALTNAGITQIVVNMFALTQHTHQLTGKEHP